MSSRSPTSTSAVGDLDGLAVPEDDGLGRREVEQGADGVVGAAAGAHLEPVAEQHERGEHRRGLVEHRPPRSKNVAATEYSQLGPDGHGDQHHHVQRPLRSAETAPVKKMDEA